MAKKYSNFERQKPKKHPKMCLRAKIRNFVFTNLSSVFLLLRQERKTTLICFKSALIKTSEEVKFNEMENFDFSLNWLQKGNKSIELIILRNNSRTALLVE